MKDYSAPYAQVDFLVRCVLGLVTYETRAGLKYEKNTQKHGSSVAVTASPVPGLGRLFRGQGDETLASASITLSRLGKKTMLSMRLVNVGAGEIMGGIVEKGKDFSELDALAEKAAEKLAKTLSTGE